MKRIIRLIKILTAITVISAVHLVSAEIVRQTDSTLISIVSGIFFWGVVMTFMDFRKWVMKSNLKDTLERKGVKDENN